MLSLLVTSSVAIMMRSYPSLMAHPNKLIYYMCISEGIVAWQAMISALGPSHVICYFRLDTLYDLTTWWETEQGIPVLLTKTNYQLLQFFEFMSLALNLFLCLDIVLTMRNPFFPHDRRMKFYIPGSIFISLLCYYMSLQRIPS